MRYGEHKTVLRDARLRTTAAEDAMLDRLADMMRHMGALNPRWSAVNRLIIMPYTTTLSRDNADIGHEDAIIGKL